MNARTPRRPRTPPRSIFAISTNFMATGTWRWPLTTAAPATCQKGIERTGYADFWELYKRNVLPRETKNYVPIIIALTLIAKDAAHYSIQVEPEAAVPTDVVKPGRAIDLRLVAETIDVDVETLRALNPSLLRLATPDDPSFELRLPVGTAQKFSAEIADIPPNKWVSWRRHRVEAGETLTSIAKKYRVTAIFPVLERAFQDVR